MFSVEKRPQLCYNRKVFKHTHAGMVKLADTLDLGSNDRKVMQVRVLLPAPERINEYNNKNRPVNSGLFLFVT